MKLPSFFHQSASWFAAFFAQQKQSRSLLEIEEAGKAFNVTENKTNFIKDIFFLEILLRLEATTFVLLVIFSETF